MLTRKQFNVLTYLAAHPGQVTQRKLAAETKMSLGSVNQVLRELYERALARDDRGITPEGMGDLEPYRAKRAVFLAAGYGSRMVPITLNTPKPLVRVCGMRIIDTLLDAVTAAGIEEIYIVRGYLREQFDQLLYKYPTIQFIDNPYYNEANTIGSVLCAGERLSSAYLLESDLLLKNPALITPYQYESNYLGIPVKRTDDYYFKLKGGYICEVGVGNTDCYQAVGISYWTRDDGLRLARDVADEFVKPGGKERTCGMVTQVSHAGEYKIGIRECTFDDVVEIDTFNELKAIDPAYGQVRKTSILFDSRQGH